MRRTSVVALAFEAVLFGAAGGCSGGDGAGSGPRFVVLPRILTVVDEPLVAAVAWWPLEPVSDALELTDAKQVAGVDAEFAWRPSGPPPPEARFAASGTEVAIGLVVAIVDADGDGGGALVQEGDGWEVSGLVPEGDDVLVGIATDYVLAWSAADLEAGDDAAELLGWPLRQGVHVMNVDRVLGNDRLAPATDRERVPIYLVGSGDAGEGLCCEPLADPRACGRPGILCPDFRNR